MFLVEFFLILFSGIPAIPGHTMPVTINSGNKEDDIQHSPIFGLHFLISGILATLGHTMPVTINKEKGNKEDDINLDAALQSISYNSNIYYY